MTTLAELCETPPAATAGQPVMLDSGSPGQWRHVVEIADPAAGASVEWFDLVTATGWCGYDLTRGADDYMGRYRASVATLEVCVDDDSLAPWNPDTSPTFGTHVPLGPGLLLRSGFVRVVSGTVVEWLPRFTNKVESWSDAAWSSGKIRRHTIVARDILSSLVGVPLPARDEANWSEHMFSFLVDSGWPYGSLIYGAQYEADTTTPILLLPARPAASNAVNELDAICDPVGLVWYTDRYGHLVVRPRVDDTFHADAFAAGATGDEYSPADPVTFGWYACDPDDTSGAGAYAIDNRTEPFGLDATERAVLNHVKISTAASGSIPAHTFDDDNPTSIQRFDRHTFQANWIAANDTVAAQILASRAEATTEARPLTTTAALPGFFPGPAGLDYLGAVTIQHRNRDDGLVAYADGWLRHQREQVYPSGCDVIWSIANIVDVATVTADAGLLPVEDLAVVDVTETAGEFSWTNPAQAIAPTHTQIRLLNSASLWATTGYPITGISWGGLAPSTGYTFQVRLIRVVDGVITHFSPVEQVSFTTDAATVPDVDDGTVTFPPPDPGCTLEWKLDASTDGGDSWSTIDTGTVTSAPWEIPTPTGLDPPPTVHRICSREVCAGVPGSYSCSNMFVGDCADPAILGTPPFDDADLRFYLPSVCPPDVIVEALSEEPATLGPAFDEFVTDADDNIVLNSSTEGLVAYGMNPTFDFSAGLNGLTDDTTIACKVLVTSQPDGVVDLFGAAGIWIRALADGADWRIRASAHEAGVGIVNINGTTNLAYGTWYDLAVVHDVDGTGDLIAYIDGAEQIASAGAVGERHPQGTYEVGLPAGSLITNLAVWARVLDPTELPGYVAPPSVTINQAAGQADPATGGSVLFTAVFSEAVTGFATGDVTLSGTAGATTAVVSGTGPTYTVTVSGMTGPGTVIASIGIGVCASVATGQLNAASTSTDNTVTWSPSLPTANLVYRWDASNAGAFTAGTPPDIATWNSLVGSLNLSQATVADRPHTGRTINGLAAADFTPTQHVFSNVANGVPITANDYTFAVVYVSDGSHSGGAGQLWAMADSASTNDHMQIYVLDSGIVNFHWQDNGVGPTLTSTTNTGDGQPHLVTVTDPSTGGQTMRLRVDGVQEDSDTEPGRGILTTNRFAVGRMVRSSSTGGFNGAIGEILIYNTILTGTTLSDMEGYLMAKWGVT